MLFVLSLILRGPCCPNCGWACKKFLWDWFS